MGFPSVTCLPSAAEVLLQLGLVLFFVFSQDERSTVFFGLVLSEPVVKRLEADAEHVSGLAAHVAALGERRFDEAPVYFFERTSDTHRDERRVRGL